MNSKNLIITIIISLAIGVSGFFAGIKYQQSKRPAFARQFQGQGGARPVNGEIIAIDNSSMTIKAQDGSSKIVILAASTQINKAATASATDLKIGDKVAAFGKENSDGSLTAQTVQLNPRR